MRLRAKFPGLAITAAFVASALGCRAESECPSGMDAVPARSQPGRELWCKTADGARARWFELSSGGGKRQSCSFLGGQPEGQYLAWHANGRTWIEGAYREGVKVGKWDQWDDAGAHVAQGEYRLGEFVAGAPVGFVAKCEAIKP